MIKEQIKQSKEFLHVHTKLSEAINDCTRQVMRFYGNDCKITDVRTGVTSACQNIVQVHAESTDPTSYLPYIFAEESFLTDDIN